ncbi:hypothetical protein AAZX31_11G256500 [Glycine max]|uniref:Uncharacterized protein n=1 Tax=Glycine soja TaxID=3848 RepID=A0A445HIP6_GLYSO|nr:uncharacterized protein LOC114382481 [Glycine soja]KAG4990017.1 hypothetical protein JHK85_033000 [Glycine max]KAG4995600.1 hypothetical protein JHK86_032427 [Glycine max]KAG5125594.1 hypothetical protein JHK82_032331 [Glycine max]KAG5147026.1 hypothetical protein JHK84_032569 [Glycine max]KHN44449.1 hypothetical protein glysoja_014490 [Glycine soja]
MEQDRRLELIDHAIQVQGSLHNNDAQYQNALSHLFSVSQLKMLKGEEILEQFEASSSSEPVASLTQETESENENGGEGKGSKNDEIIKELKKVKRQNFVTHCLLSVMIVLNVAWQLSEVSLILKVKDGLSHPFRSKNLMTKNTHLNLHPFLP